MELIWLEDFVALANTGNFSRAAEIRHVTQPAFSRRIRALEDWIGAMLFIRGPQGVTLTTAGEKFRSGAEEIVRRLHQLCNEAREAGDKEVKTLHFAATHALSFTFFPGWIWRLDSDGTLGAIRLISDSMQACEQVMLQGQAQFLLCYHHEMARSRFDPSQFESVQVGEDSLVLLSAADALGSPLWKLSDGGKPIHYLAYSEESGLGRIIAAKQSEGFFPPLETVVTSRLAVTLQTMARDGRGVAWLPLSLATADMQAGRLVRVGTPEQDIKMAIRLFRPRSPQSQNAEKFWMRLRTHQDKTG
jgi:LysR family transcriptional regulator, hypochlorite-specific transcription factor HypT